MKLPKVELKFIKTDKELTDLIASIMHVSVTKVAVDTETTGLDTLVCELVGVGVCWDEAKSYYISAGLFNEYKGQWNKVFAEKTIIFHNAKFDLQVLWRYGYIFYDIADTMLMDYMLDPDKGHGLKGLIKEFFDVDSPSYSDLRAPFHELTEEEQLEYAAKDPWYTFVVYEYLLPQIKKFLLPDKTYTNFSSLLKIEYGLVKVLAKMELTGFFVDKEYLSSFAPIIDKHLEVLRKKAHKIAGHEFELDSPAQVSTVLFDELKLPIQRVTEKGKKKSTDAKSLEKLKGEHEIIEVISEYREMAKLAGTYIHGIIAHLHPETSVCHATYLQAIVPTHRLASGAGDIGPGEGGKGGCNIQNLPKDVIKVGDVSFDVRNAFVARPGMYFISADYKQIQFKIAMMLAHETEMIKKIRGGLDAHTATAALMFDVADSAVTKQQRTTAKTINFGLLFGMDAYGLTHQLKVSREEALNLYNKYFSTLTKTRDYISAVKEHAKQYKFVSTYFGFFRYIKDLEPKLPDEDYKLFKKRYNRGLRGSFNTIIQGGEADVMRAAMVNLDRRLLPFSYENAHTIASIHDQLIVEVNKSIKPEEIMEPMRQAMVFPIPGWELPLDIDFAIGDRWGELKDFELPQSLNHRVDIIINGEIDIENLSKLRHLAKDNRGSYDLKIQFDGKWLDGKRSVMPSKEFIRSVREVVPRGSEIFVDSKKI